MVIYKYNEKMGDFMKKSTKNFLIGAGITAFAAGVAAAYAISVKKLVEIALDREIPLATERGKKLISGSDKLSEIAEKLNDSAAELEKIPMDIITLKASDGTELVGHWYCPENAERVIVAMHGWRSGWSQDFGGISPFWHENNCAVLYAEQRAQGSSGGDYIGFGLLERYDCDEWANWADERVGGKLPIYLCGISMGATTVLMASGGNLPESVQGIIADCGFTSPHAIWKHVAENNLKIPYGLYSAAANDLCMRKIKAEANSYSTTKALSENTVPVLFIHGTDDRFVPIEMTYENYKACKAPKRLFIVPGAEHGLSYLEDKEGYENIIKKFWREFDK